MKQRHLVYLAILSLFTVSARLMAATTFNWANNAGGNWSATANWNPSSSYPQYANSDTVILGNNGGAFSATAIAVTNDASGQGALAVFFTNNINYTLSGTGKLRFSAATPSITSSGTGVNTINEPIVIFNPATFGITNNSTGLLNLGGQLQTASSASSPTNVLIFGGSGNTLLNNNIFTVAGNACTNSLQQSGNGTLTLTADPTSVLNNGITVNAGTLIIKSATASATLTCTYGGATTIASGATLQLGDGIAGSTSFGDLGAGTIITNNGTLLVSPGYAVGTAFARTVNNNGNVNFYWTNGGFNCDFTTVINGSGTVTKDGPSRAWLKSASGYTGNTTNRAGILDVTGDSALGGAGGKIVFAAGGTGILRTRPSAFSSGRAIQLDGNGQMACLTAGDTATFSGNITGAGAVSLGEPNSSGAVIFSGNNAYTNSTTVTYSTLRAGSTTGFSPNSAFALWNTANVTLDLNGNNETIGSLAGGGATGGNVTLGAGTLSSGGNNASTTFAGIISGTTGTSGVIKQGSGIWNLTGANTYSGNTTISAGTLLVNGSISTGAVTNYTGATLGGTGTIGGNVGFGFGAYALFTNGATLTISGSLTLNNNTVELNLSNNVPAGTYLLANYSGGSGSFNATPTIANGGSFAANTTNYITTTGGQVKLVVLNTYTVTYNANGLSGSAPTGANAYTNGATVIVSGAGSLTIPAGYHFAGWTNSSGTSYSAGSTFAMPANNVTLYAQVAPNNYTLIYNGGASGTISGVATQTVAYLTSGSAVTAVANPGYGFANWSDGVTTATRTDTALIGGTNVTATYTNNLYTLTYAAGAGGSISGATSQTVPYLSSGSAVTAVASNGYAFTTWSDGVTTSNRTDTALIGGTNVTASFVSTCTSPSIVGGIDPGSATLTAFSPLVLNLTNVTGSADLAYQWRSNSMAILNATNSSYTNLSVVMANAGNYDCVVTNGCGSVTSSVVVVTINPATPIAQTATTASAIAYGQTLGSSTITVGSFTNALGQTVAISSHGFVDASIAPNAGTTNVAVYYLPTDSANYVNVTNTVSVTVSPAALSITANNDSKVYGQTKTYGAGSTNFTSGGLVNSETIGTVTIASTSSPTNGAAATDNVGSYVLTPSAATGGSFNTNNYSITYNTGTLSVIQASTFVGASSTKNPSGYKDTVAYTATLPADATGNVVFSSTNGAFSTNAVSSGSASSLSITNLLRGTNVITVVYSGDGNYLGSTTNLDQIVTNHPPVANVMAVTRTAGLALIIKLSDIATNWSDVDGDTVELASVTMQSTNGINLFPLNWSTNLDGSIVTTNGYAYIGYTNSPNVNDQISYGISDGFGGTNIGYVNIVIQGSVTGTNSITGHDFSSPYSNTVMAYGIPYFYYTLERSTNLTSPVWVDVSTNQAAANGAINAVDTFWDLGGVKPSPSAFYQLKWQP